MLNPPQIIAAVLSHEWFDYFCRFSFVFGLFYALYRNKYGFFFAGSMVMLAGIAATSVVEKMKPLHEMDMVSMGFWGLTGWSIIHLVAFIFPLMGSLYLLQSSVIDFCNWRNSQSSRT